MEQVPRTGRTSHNSISRRPTNFPDKLPESETILAHPISWLKSRYHHLLETHHAHSAKKSEDKGNLEDAVKEHLLAASESKDSHIRKAEFYCAALLLEKLGRQDEAESAYIAAYRAEAEQFESEGRLELAAQLRFDIAISSSKTEVKKAEFMRAAELFSRLRWHLPAGHAYEAALKLEENFEDKMHLAHLISGHYAKEKEFSEIAKIWLDLSYESQNPVISRQMFVLAGMCMAKNMQYSEALNYFFIALRDENDARRRLDILGKVGECLVSQGHWREAVLCFAAIYHHLNDTTDFVRKWNLAMRIDHLARNANKPMYSEAAIKSIISGFERPEEKTESERRELLWRADCLFCDMARGEGFDPEKIEPPLIRRVA